MHTATLSVDEVTTGDYVLVGGVFRRVTAAEYHSRREAVMICLAGYGFHWLRPGTSVTVAA